MSLAERFASSRAEDDIVLPFAVEGLSTRGRLVRLGPAIDRLLKSHAYPEPVSKLVAEAAALSALRGSTLKLKGRFQLQTKSEGPVGMLLVDFDAPSNLRALARFDAQRVARAAADGADLLGRGHMAFTIDPGGDMTRYQGVISLEGQGLEASAHSYFERSEQIPTLVRLVVGETVSHGERAWRAGGLIVQYLPKAPRRRADFHPGDAPEGTEPDRVEEDDAWTEARALAGTTEAHELLDPTLSSERLLFRLFNQRGVRVFEPTGLASACRCSAEGVDAMLRSFPPEELKDMVADDGMITVTCEFCSTRRVFSPSDYGV